MPCHAVPLIRTGFSNGSRLFAEASELNSPGHLRGNPLSEVTR